MTATEYDVDHFIAKFEAIPERDWITHSYTDGFGGKCALGHCGELPGIGREANSLRELFRNHGLNVIKVNDWKDPQYQQRTSKDRILAALRDIKAKQEAA